MGSKIEANGPGWVLLVIVVGLAIVGLVSLIT